MVRGDAARIRVEREFGIDQVAVIFQQPIHAVRLSALLIGGERQDDVAVRDIAFLLQTNEIGDGNGIGFLHVLGAAPIEIAVLFHEFERIGGPILAPRLDHVEVTDDQNGARRRAGPSPIAGNQISLTVIGPEDDNIGCGKPSVEQSLRHGLRSRRGASDGIGGVDLDQLFENVVRHLAGGGILVGPPRTIPLAQTDHRRGQ